MAKSARPSILSLPATAQELARLQGLPETPLKMRLIPRVQHQRGVSRAPAKAACGSWPSPKPQEVVQVEAPHAFVFHHANAHESPDGQSIVVDSIAYACFPGFFEVRPSSDSALPACVSSGPDHLRTLAATSASRLAPASYAALRLCWSSATGVHLLCLRRTALPAPA